MLGNDIVDLQKAAKESNWRRKGYLDKIFCAEEKELIISSDNPTHYIWLFWSMKEAAYKIVNRATGVRFYDPIAFTCKNIVQGRIGSGEVDYKGQIYYTQSCVTSAMIHTIALSKKSSNLVGSEEPTRLPFEKVEVLYLPNITSYLDAFDIRSITYNLTKNEHGIPELIHRNSGTKHFASISHHGRFLAIVYFRNH